ncbi:MAG: hypothetical protein JOY77_03170 [Alphaproteobacteria bacterium]|nr:hypothetical protein [Alphaproteobacteria bacterium]MBV9061913.1 hypothetical protein [Alphaproteobacteria bacterium]
MKSIYPFILLSIFATAARAQTGDADRCAKGEGEDAIAACSEIIAAADGDVTWALFDRARAYFNARMYGSAISDLTDVLLKKKDDVEALENRALAFQALDDYQHAIGDFSRLIDLQPSSANAHRERCWARAAWNRDLDDALEDCDQALSLKPGDVLVLDARCLAEIRKAAYAVAISNCSAALGADPNLASSYYLRGVARRKSGDAVRGDADIDSARNRDSNVVKAFILMGVKP